MNNITNYVSRSEVQMLMDQFFPRVTGPSAPAVRTVRRAGILDPPTGASEETNIITTFNATELTGTLNHGELGFAVTLAMSTLAAFQWSVFRSSMDGFVQSGVEPLLNFTRELAYRLGIYYYLISLPQLGSVATAKLARLIQRHPEVEPLGHLDANGTELYLGLSHGAGFRPPDSTPPGVKLTDKAVGLEMLKFVGAATQQGVEPRRLLELVELGVASATTRRPANDF